MFEPKIIIAETGVGFAFSALIWLHNLAVQLDRSDHVSPFIKTFCGYVIINSTDLRNVPFVVSRFSH